MKEASFFSHPSVSHKSFANIEVGIVDEHKADIIMSADWKRVQPSLRWHKNGFTGKDIVATKIDPKINNYRFIKTSRKEVISRKEGFRASQKVQQVPGSSPQRIQLLGSSATSAELSGMAAGRDFSTTRIQITAVFVLMILDNFKCLKEDE
ncbi:hypothetical protein cypCar_00045272 [Cyprinus carpio]|nr:hypothetical protein cypCar_00045272 [Cyprinus carpio]